jgi:predicted transcriptional regulator
MDKIIEQASEFLKLVTHLRKEGYKMHEIAHILELHPPVLSGLCKTVIPAMITPKKQGSSEELINAAFDLVNNISKEKTIKNLPRFISSLKNVSSETVINDNPPFYEPYKKTIANSFDVMSSHFVGLYDCFTISSNSNMLKHEPLRVSVNSLRKYVEVTKGNQYSHYTFEGFMMLCGSHMISIQLVDSRDDVQETGLIQLIQPFTRKFKLLRGIYLTLGFSRAPIARRIVLSKVKSECTQQEFDEIPTHYYNLDECPPEISKEIIDYVSDANDIVECVSLPHPTFDVMDLVREKKMVSMFRTDL